MMKSMKCFMLTAMMSLTACGNSPYRSSMPSSYQGDMIGRYVEQAFGRKYVALKFISKRQKIEGKTYQVTWFYGQTNTEYDDLLYIKKKDKYDVYRYDFRVNSWSSTADYSNNIEKLEEYMLHLNDLNLTKEDIVKKDVLTEGIRYTYKKDNEQKSVVVSKDKYHVCLASDDFNASISEYKSPAVSEIPNIKVFNF